uniref:Digalactosyldiacylglycerol synthase n=1 Tax=Salix viminalis TaxID=40686 RepID=A0A6N2NCZ4_SALVM
MEATSSPTRTNSNNTAFSLFSRGWKEVRDSADADLQLMRARANSFKNLANSFDREIENFFNSSSIASFSVPTPLKSSTSPKEIDFVKKLQPKISEIRRVYSAPEISKKGVLGEGKEEGGGQFGEWEPILALKRRLKEFEKKSEFGEIFGGFKNSEFVEKLKSSLKTIRKESQESKEVQPLDVTELLAYLVRQSEPFLDQIGVRKDVCDKIVGGLCRKHKNQFLLPSLSSGKSTLLDENANDELDLRIASHRHCYDGGFWTDLSKHHPSDGRACAIVTTASLPWMTGTAVNPLFRAAYLAKSERQNVTLLVPWLCKSEQELVYPNNLTFTSPEEQENYIRNWLEERVGFKADFKISFYPGKFSKERRSIIPAGDTSQFVPSKDADIAILEEPEHLNWYHHGKRWTDKFNHVVGVVHTNYLEYIKREKNGALQAFLVKHINNLVTRAYCHKVLRLSAATQDLPKSVICNVHGVNPKFLKIGEKVAAERNLGSKPSQKEHIS